MKEIIVQPELNPEHETVEGVIYEAGLVNCIFLTKNARHYLGASDR